MTQTQFKFPNGVDIFEPNLINNITVINADHVNDLRNSIKKIQEYLIIDDNNLFDGYIITKNQSVLSALKTIDGYLSIINDILTDINNHYININNINYILNSHINTKQAHLSDGYLVDTNSHQTLKNKILLLDENIQVSPKITIQTNTQEESKKQIVIKDKNGLDVFYVDGLGNLKCNNITYNNVEILNAQVTSDFLVVDGYCIIGRQNTNTDYLQIYANTKIDADIDIVSNNINISSVESNITSSNINISGNVNVNNNLRVYGNLSIGNSGNSTTLSVLSSANFFSNVNILSNVNITNSLTRFNTTNLQLSSSNIDIYNSNNINIYSGNINIDSTINILKDITTKNINSQNIVAKSIETDDFICNNISIISSLSSIDGYINTLRINDGYVDNLYINNTKFNIPKKKVIAITNNLPEPVQYTHDLKFPFTINAYIKNNNILYPIDISNCVTKVDNSTITISTHGYNINQMNQLLIIMTE